MQEVLKLFYPYMTKWFLWFRRSNIRYWGTVISRKQSRLQVGIAAARSVLESASKYNPLQGVSSVTQLSGKLRKEVTACIDVKEYSRPEAREELMKRLRSNWSWIVKDLCGTSHTIIPKVFNKARGTEDMENCMKLHVTFVALWLTESSSHKTHWGR